MSSFDDVVERFNHLEKEVARLQKETRDQQNQIAGYLAQLQSARNKAEQDNKANEVRIKGLRTELDKERDNVKALQLATAKDNRRAKDMRASGPTKDFINTLKVERDQHAHHTKGVQDNYNRMTQERNILCKQLDQIQVKNQELIFELEYPQRIPLPEHITSKSCASEAETTLPEVPFVLVLIDGDAYKFADMLPNQYANSAISSGTRAALSVKEQLRAYIDTHHLPSHCRLMVRVLANAAGLKSVRGSGKSKHNPRSVNMVEEFMVRFTEFSPLFEFFDAGSGKERVDRKIHELYTTFLPNPACHKIFLAVARDNGFARMFEESIHHPAARAKTCLISSGDIALEIERLNLETIEWPSVFVRTYRPKVIQTRIAKQEDRRNKEEAALRETKAELIKNLGKDGYEDLIMKKAFQTLTNELVGSDCTQAPVLKLAGFHQRVIGLRFGHTQQKGLCSESVGSNMVDYGHEGFCTDVGVD